MPVVPVVPAAPSGVCAPPTREASNWAFSWPDSLSTALLSSLLVILPSPSPSSALKALSMLVELPLLSLPAAESALCRSVLSM